MKCLWPLSDWKTKAKTQAGLPAAGISVFETEGYELNPWPKAAEKSGAHKQRLWQVKAKAIKKKWAKTRR